MEKIVLNKNDIMEVLENKRLEMGLNVTEFIDFLDLNPNTYFRYKRKDNNDRCMSLNTAIMLLDKVGYNFNIVEKDEYINFVENLKDEFSES